MHIWVTHTLISISRRLSTIEARVENHTQSVTAASFVVNVPTSTSSDKSNISEIFCGIFQRVMNMIYFMWVWCNSRHTHTSKDISITPHPFTSSWCWLLVFVHIWEEKYIRYLSWCHTWYRKCKRWNVLYVLQYNFLDKYWMQNFATKLICNHRSIWFPRNRRKSISSLPLLRM